VVTRKSYGDLAEPACPVSSAPAGAPGTRGQAEVVVPPYSRDPVSALRSYTGIQMSSRAEIACYFRA